MSIWLLPENIADMLPREARRVEQLRRGLLDLFTSHGFEQVRPPLIEYVDSLLTGTGSDLDLRTFKLIDQASGRTMGLRADMTPQVARIDAHILNRPGVTRLCYAGALLHARPLHPLASREPYVAGVELFGAQSKEADLEVLRLAVEALHVAGIGEVCLDIGHTAVARAILERDPASNECLERAFYALSHKDVAGLRGLSGVLREETINALCKLTKLFGGFKVLEEIREEFFNFPSVTEAVAEVQWLAERCGAEHLSFDFSDVHGYQYLTGVTFAVHTPGRYQAVLRGGRYDNISATFGRARPAVGFTIYVREIAALSQSKRPYAVLAPEGSDDSLLQETITKLRNEGKIIVQLLPSETVEGLEESFRLDEELYFENGEWRVQYRSQTK